MSTLLHRQLTIVVIVALLAPIVAQAGRHPLNEDSAVNLLLRTLEHDNVYKNRISLDCVIFDAEEKTNASFQFVLRENHTAQCGGDPQTSPVVDRYRVYRASGKIEWLEPVQDKWQLYNPAKIR